MCASSIVDLSREEYLRVMNVKRILRRSVGAKLPYNPEFDRIIPVGAEGKYSLNTADITRLDYLLFCAAEHYDPVIVSRSKDHADLLRAKHAKNFSPQAIFCSQYCPEIFLSKGLIFCNDWWSYKEGNKADIYATRRVKLAVGFDSNLSGGTVANPL